MAPFLIHVNADDNVRHARNDLFLGSTLVAALAQAIGLIDPIDPSRPRGRLGRLPARRAGLASDRKSGYRSGYGTWVLENTRGNSTG